MGAIVLMSIVTLVIIAFAMFLFTGKVRQEPHYRVNKSLVIGSMIISFTLAYAIFHSHAAGILVATVIVPIAIGVNIWYESLYHADCGVSPYGISYRENTNYARVKSDIHNDPFRGGPGPSAR